jgi:hypothetical protein
MQGRRRPSAPSRPRVSDGGGEGIGPAVSKPSSSHFEVDANAGACREMETEPSIGAPPAGGG